MAPSKLYTILLTGGSSGFGLLSARRLAKAGHTVYASVLRAEPSFFHPLESYAKEHSVNLRWVELDITSSASIHTAVHTVTSEAGAIDALIHNAGHMCYGPAEAFTPAQLLAQFEVNALGAHRLTRAVLPHMRAAPPKHDGEKGLIVWVGSAGTRGGVPPFFGPYFAAKAAMDALAVSYAAEVALWGVESAIVVPGPYTKGTNHFKDASHPEEKEVAELYGEDGPYGDLQKKLLQGTEEVVSRVADPDDVAKAIVEVVDQPFGKRPFRVHINTGPDGAHVVSAVADRMREQVFQTMGIGYLLSPRPWKE